MPSVSGSQLSRPQRPVDNLVRLGACRVACAAIMRYLIRSCETMALRPRRSRRNGPRSQMVSPSRVYLVYSDPYSLYPQMYPPSWSIRSDFVMPCLPLRWRNPGRRRGTGVPSGVPYEGRSLTVRATALGRLARSVAVVLGVQSRRSAVDEAKKPIGDKSICCGMGVHAVGCEAVVSATRRGGRNTLIFIQPLGIHPPYHTATTPTSELPVKTQSSSCR